MKWQWSKIAAKLVEGFSLQSHIKRVPRFLPICAKKRAALTQSSERTVDDSVAFSRIPSRAPPLWRKQPQADVENAVFLLFFFCYFYLAGTTPLSPRVSQEETLSAGSWWRRSARSLLFLTTQVQSWRETFWGGLQFVIGPVNLRTTEVRSVCAKLSGRQFVRASRESQVRVCILIKSSPSACLRLLGGGMPGHRSVLCSGEFTLRAAALLDSSRRRYQMAESTPAVWKTLHQGRERQAGWVGGGSWERVVSPGPAESVLTMWQAANNAGDLLKLSGNKFILYWGKQEPSWEFVDVCVHMCV